MGQTGTAGDGGGESGVRSADKGELRRRGVGSRGGARGEGGAGAMFFRPLNFFLRFQLINFSSA